MKIFWTYWKQFHKKPLPLSMYLATALWLTILLAFNYTLDFEDSVIDQDSGKPIRWLWYILYNGLGYLGTLMIVKFTFKEHLRLTAKFWWLLTLGLLILTFDRSAYPYFDWLKESFSYALFHFHFKVINNVQSLFTICLLLFLLYLWDKPKEKFGFYGFRRKGVNFKLYGYLFLAMVLIIVLACFLPDIQEYYPVYQRSGGHRWASYLDISEVWAVLVFEFSYLIDFISVELFFRGFLVLGLARFMGKSALLPMITLYAMLHFGKPIGEAISSIFGGYILGVLAFQTRNIYGGIVLHGGIAILMEIFAYLI